MNVNTGFYTEKVMRFGEVAVEKVTKAMQVVKDVAMRALDAIAHAFGAEIIWTPRNVELVNVVPVREVPNLEEKVLGNTETEAFDFRNATVDELQTFFQMNYQQFESEIRSCLSGIASAYNEEQIVLHEAISRLNVVYENPLIQTAFQYNGSLGNICAHIEEDLMLQEFNYIQELLRQFDSLKASKREEYEVRCFIEEVVNKFYNEFTSDSSVELNEMYNTISAECGRIFPGEFWVLKIEIEMDEAINELKEYCDGGQCSDLAIGRADSFVREYGAYLENEDLKHLEEKFTTLHSYAQKISLKADESITTIITTTTTATTAATTITTSFPQEVDSPYKPQKEATSFQREVRVSAASTSPYKTTPMKNPATPSRVRLLQNVRGTDGPAQSLFGAMQPERARDFPCPGTPSLRRQLF